MFHNFVHSARFIRFSFTLASGRENTPEVLTTGQYYPYKSRRAVRGGSFLDGSDRSAALRFGPVNLNYKSKGWRDVVSYETDYGNLMTRVAPETLGGRSLPESLAADQVFLGALSSDPSLPNRLKTFATIAVL
jgi:hypothetical protein